MMKKREGELFGRHSTFSRLIGQDCRRFQESRLNFEKPLKNVVKIIIKKSLVFVIKQKSSHKTAWLQFCQFVTV
jgi:hypothetical protein